MTEKLTQKNLEKTFQQIMNLWVNPEIKRRQRKGWKGESIWAIEIILTPNIKPKVRLNNQVQIIVRAKAKKDIKKGELVVFNTDIDDVEDIQLKERPKNSGYIILLSFKDHWTIRFDFRYYMETAKEHIEVAKQYYESAKENLEKNRLRPFFEECWAVAELLSACNFLLLGQKYKENHRKFNDKIRGWSDLGNIKKEFSETLEKLFKLRDSARYVKSKDFEEEDTKKIMKILKEMFEFTEKLVS